MNNKLTKKVTVIGSGFVGSSVAYTLMQSSLISEIVIIDRNKDKATGEAMDLNHGMPFVSPVNIYAGDYSDCKGSDIIIITAGANQKPDETRLDLVKNNTSIFRNIISEVTKYNSNCILLVVTNPVDILTYVTYKLSGFPKNRVIGSGTVLDTARFKYLLGEHIGIDTRNIHGYILGEHGDSEVAAWSLTNVAGIPIKDYCDSCKGCNDSLSRYNIYNEVKNAAYEIIKRKGATFYGVALAVQKIVECIIRNENSILTVSSLLEGQFGLSDVCLSVPTVVNANGIDRILEVPLNGSEKELLKKSGESLKEIIKDIDI